MSEDNLIEEQARSIVQKDKIIAKLRRRIQELEQLLQRDLETQIVIYRELEPKFEQWKKPIFMLIIQLAERHKRAVSYREIIKAFNAKYPHTKLKPATIRRRVRTLREDGLLAKQGRDRFYPTIGGIE